MASASQELSQFFCLFRALGCSLGEEGVRNFHVICCCLNSEKIKSEALTMIEIAECLKHYLVDEKKVVTFTYLILKQLHGVTLSDNIQTLFKPFLIEDCCAINELDVNINMNNIDCRILIINFFYILAEKEYKYILDSFWSISDVHCSLFPNRWMLAEEIFNTGLITDPCRDVDEFCTIAEFFDRQSLFTKYYKKYNISEIAVGDEDIVTSDGSENKRKAIVQKVEELISADKNIHDATQKKCPLKFNRPCGLLSILMGIVLLAIIGAFIAAVLISRQCQSTIATGSVNGSDSSIITINTNGFTHNTDDITLSLITDNDDVVVDVFREDCDKENKTDHLLPPKIQKEIYADNFQREAYNYNEQDYPIYGAKGSQLQYNMSASTPCTVITNLTLCIGIRIFNNYNLYSAATNPGDMYQPHVDGTIAQSGCLPVGVGGSVCNSTWTYIFDRPQYVWVSLEHQACVKVNGNISGNIVNNTLGSVLPVCSLTPLTVHSKTCIINRTCSGVNCWLTTPLQCIYLQKEPNDDDPTTKQYKVSYHTHPPFYGCSFFNTFYAIIGLFVVFICCLCCSCCWCCGNCLCEQWHSLMKRIFTGNRTRSKSNGSNGNACANPEGSINSRTLLLDYSRDGADRSKLD